MFKLEIFHKFLVKIELITQMWQPPDANYKKLTK